MALARAKSVGANLVIGAICLLWPVAMLGGNTAGLRLWALVLALFLWPIGLLHLYRAATFRVEEEFLPRATTKEATRLGPEPSSDPDAARTTGTSPAPPMNEPIKLGKAVGRCEVLVLSGDRCFGSGTHSFGGRFICANHADLYEVGHELTLV